MASAPLLAPSARATRSDKERLQPRLLIRSITFYSCAYPLSRTLCRLSRRLAHGWFCQEN
jgi:hypothetical protein